MSKKIALKCTDGIIYKGFLSYQGDNYIRIAQVEPCSTDESANFKKLGISYNGDVIFHNNNIIWWYTE